MPDFSHLTRAPSGGKNFLLWPQLTRFHETQENESDRSGIERSLKLLSQATEAFAAERMNRGIRRALAGRRVEDL